MKTVAVAILSSLVVVWGADAASHAVDLRAATVSPPALAVGDAVSVTFRDGVDYRLTVDSEFPSFAGAHAFSARLDDGVCAASFVVSGDAFTVEVRDISGNRLWRGCVRGGAAAVETVDLAAHRGGDCIEVETPEPESDEAEAPVPKKSTGLLSAVPGNPFDDTIVAPAPVTVDIMLVFDNGARAWTESKAAYGGSITNFAVAQVARMNEVLRNTDLHTNFWFRLVDVATVDGRWTQIDKTVLPAMRAGVMDASGIWSEVSARREACGADVVSLMVDTGSASGTTGIGYITHGTTYNTWVNTYRTWCYSCCAIRSVDLNYTLCHEVGHNMGLAHSPTLSTWDKPGTFDYSNGYNFTGDDGKRYNTVMAYEYDRFYSDYREIPYFSSPCHAYAGVPVGTAASNDCTRALRQTCAGIADWHAQTIPLPSDIVFSPAASSAYRISLSTLGGYEIRYTTDGLAPTRESALYEGPIKLTSGEMTVKAVAVVDGETLGAVATKTYGAAVELGEYVWLEAPSASWAWGDWSDQNGGVVYSTFWTNSADRTAVVDVDGLLNVDRDISLGTLVVGGATNMEIAVGTNRLSAANLEVVARATLSGATYSFDKWRLHPESTLLLAPGAGSTVTLQGNLALAYPTAVFAVTNGTVVAGASGSAAGQFDSAALHVRAGGTLKIAGGGWNTGSATETPLTIDRGGTLEIAAVDDLHRKLTLDGGTLRIAKSGRAASFYDLQMRVTDDSTVTDAGSAGEIWIRAADARIDVADGKTLTFDAALTRPADNGFQSLGKGFVKTGKGEIAFLREIAHSGTNTIRAGTLTVACNSTATHGLGWILDSGATLKIARGASLQVPSLALAHGASLVLPAASSAPLSVSGAVDLTHVALTLTDADDLSYGATYPLISASGGFSGVSRAKKDGLPALGDGLVWHVAAAAGTLSATVATPEEAVAAVPFVSNDESMVLDVPEDAVRLPDGGVALAAKPLAVGGLDTKAIALTLDVEIPDAAQTERRVICSWKVGEHVIYCVRETDGTLDCYWVNETSHVANAKEKVVLSGGRHTICVGYYSSAYDGTWAYVDGKPAYSASGLKWQDSTVGDIAIGGIVDDAETGFYAGLVVRQVALVDAAATAPLAMMTDSAEDEDAIKYNYVAARAARAFATFPAGGFMTHEAVLSAEFTNDHDAASISVVASFPTNAVGTVMSIWVQLNGSSKVTCQAEYEGDGTFAIRYDGNALTTLPSTPVAPADPSVGLPHLYTMTFLSGYGVTLYQDGVEIARSEAPYNYTTYAGNKIRSPINFGCGGWHPWYGSFVDNPCPMPDFKVYASHIALGTDDVLASIEPVIESLGFDAAYGEMPIAEKLSYLPECQTATGVSAPPGEDAEVLPVVEVLVAFDRGAQAYVADKGVTLAEFAETQIAKMNAALATNRLDRFYSYGLAGVCKVDATYATIEAVTSKLVSGEGPLVSLRAARELYGADTVALLANTSGATLGDSIPLSGTSDVASRHESAFSVCSIRAVDTGKQHTLLHETAHNMGCGHARAQSVVNSPFEYGRGYYFKDGDVMRHTIMAYGGDDDASWYFSTSSDAFGFKLGDATNDNARVLRETCGEVAKWREGAAIGFAGAEVEGAVLQTSRRFPWFAEGDALRSFRQTNYLHQSTMPLKATVTGPKVLSFKHRSYFGGKSVASSTYSHFDVLLDDSPVIAQTECTNSWSSAQVEIPEGTHEIVFVFSQRFAMNNPGDYKDGTPEMDDAVWIKDLALAAVDETVLDIPAGTTYALADVGRSVSAIVGAGTLACGSVLPDPAYGFTNATWQGTVAFADLAETDDATKDFRFERYGNAHSTIRLSRCALPYLKNNNATFAGRLELVADGGGQAAFSTKDGYSDAYNVFGVLAGDGSMVFTGNPKQGYVFNVATNYTGSISVEHGGYYGSVPQGRRIVFGTVAQAADLPSQSATIAVQPRAAASIGASARWYAYHGIEIAGTLRVKGPGAKFDCDASAATGLEFVDGATLLFETTNAALSLEKELRFTNGIVKIAFAEGVTPAEGATLIAWPITATAPDGVFAFASVSNATRWVLEKTGAGLIVRRGSFAVPGASAALEPGAALTAWLLDAGFTGADGTPWCAFVSRTGANGYANWKNFILGYPADDPAAKFEARLEIRNGQVVIETTEGDFPAGCNIVKRLFKKEKLDDPWPSAGEEMTGRRATVGEAAGSGFYKVNVSLESK